MKNVETLWEQLNLINSIYKSMNNLEASNLLCPHQYLILHYIENRTNVGENEIYSELKNNNIIEFEEELRDELLKNLSNSKLIIWDRVSHTITISADGKTWINNISQKIKKDKKISLPKIEKTFKEYLATKETRIIEKLTQTKILELIIQFYKEYGLSYIVGERKNANFKKNPHIIAEYLVWLKDKDNNTYDYICNLAISIAVTQLWDVPKISIGNLSNTKFYLDTSILFDLSGAHGDEVRKLSEQITSFIISKRGQLKVFERTFYEMDSIFFSARKYYNSTDFDAGIASKLAKFFRDNRKEQFSNITDLGIWYEELKKSISSKYCITEDNTDYYDTDSNMYQIDSQKLTEILSLKREHADIDERRLAIQHDVEIISSIYKIRKENGKRVFKDFQKIPAVFITANTGLYDACKELSRIDAHVIPPVLTVRRILYMIYSSQQKEFYSRMSLDLLQYVNVLVSQNTSILEQMTKEVISSENKSNTDPYILSKIAIEQMRDMIFGAVIDNSGIVELDVEIESAQEVILGLMKSTELLKKTDSIIADQLNTIAETHNTLATHQSTIETHQNTIVAQQNTIAKTKKENNAFKKILCIICFGLLAILFGVGLYFSRLEYKKTGTINIQTILLWFIGIILLPIIKSMWPKKE